MITKYTKSAMYFIIFTLLLFVFTIASSTTAWAGTATINPSDDTVNYSHLIDEAGDDNYDGISLSIGRNMADWVLSYQRTAMKFNLSSIPEGASITSATLRIYVIDHAGSAKIKLISVGDAWSETAAGGVGDPSFPAYDASNVINGYSNYVVTATGYNDFNVKDYINQEFSGDKVASFVFLGEEGAEAGTNDEINIYADENGINRPELVVNYTTSTITIAATTGMTEGNLDTNSITVTLGGGETFADGTLDSANFTLDNAPAGLTVESLDYTDTTHCRVNLAYDGTDFDSDITNLGLTISGAELNGGSDLTASSQLTITATNDPESISISDDGNIIEKAEDGEVIAVTLTGGTFVSPINPANWTVTNLPVGVSRGSVTRIDANHVQITLLGNATEDYDTNITNVTVACTTDEYSDSSGGARLSANSGITLTANNGPEVTTVSPATSIAPTSATVSGNITSNGGLPITERGIEYKKNTDGVYTKVPEGGTAVGAYSVNLTGLEPATNYDVRAYAINGDGTSYGAVVNFTTTNTNPTISDIADKSADEDTPNTISFTINDAETAAGSLLISATSNNTTLIPNTGYSYGGSGTDRTLTITPASNQYGTATVTVTVTDGNGGTAQDTFILTVNPVNDAPEFLLFGSGFFPVYNEDEVTNIGNQVNYIFMISPATDVDTMIGTLGIAITSTSITMGNGTWQYSPDGGINWNDIGAVSENSALLLIDFNSVRFLPDGKNGATGFITYRAWDKTSGVEGSRVDTSINGGTSAFSANTNTAHINVIDVNDAPVLEAIVPSLTTIVADEINNSGQTVASFIGTSISDVDSGALKGIAITSTINGKGSWQYSIDNGGTWTGIGAVAGNNALLLRDTDKIRFVPNGQDYTAASITYRAWDRTLGAQGNKVDATINGGTTAFSTAIDTAIIIVNKIPPRIQSVAVPSNGTYKAGHNLDFTVNLNKLVNVTGVPQLSLTIGSETRTANYVSLPVTSALVFRYTIQAGDNDSDGIAVNGLELNGGSIVDDAGSDADLTLNGVGSTTGVKVDTTAPTVQAVSVPSNATYKAGQNLNFTINYNEIVNVTGAPQLSLTIGSVTRTATYASGSGTSDLVFRYIVQVGDNDSDGITINSLDLNGGAIKDSVGNDAALTLNGVGATTEVKVDAVAPTVQSVNIPSNGSYKSGENLEFTVNFSEDVAVTGTPKLSLTIGSTTKTATYITGIGTSSLTFAYTVQASDDDSDGITINSLNLDGGNIKDNVGHDAVLTLNSVGSTAEVKVDTTAPTVQTVAVPSNGTYKTGDNLDFTVNFSETVTVNGTPQLSLTIGSTAKAATYVSGSGTSALVFRYTVQAGDIDSDGISVGGLELNGGTIRDNAGNDGILTLNSVGTTAGITVDATAPTVQSVAVPSNGTYKIGDNLDFTVNSNENVNVTGVPQLSLTIGSVTRKATYISGSGTSALVFRYTVQAGDIDSDGILIAGLGLNGGTIKDSLGNDAALTLNGVAATADIKVDAVAPTIIAANLSADNTYIDITFDEGIYGANNGVTALTASRLALTFTKNTGTATNVTISSIKKNDDTVEGLASPLVGGETTVRVFLNITGTPNGAEVIEIKTANASSIYDKAGNVALVTETTGLKGLKDKVAPIFNPATGTAVDTTKKIVTLTFSENVVNALSDLATLKNAVTFAADGTNYSALGSNDTVAITSGKLVVTLENALTGSTSKIKILGNSLKDGSENLLIEVVTTNAIAVTTVPSGGGSSGGSSGSSGSSGGTQSGTNQQQITVDVTNGTTNNSITQTQIQRTTNSDGTKQDEVQYTQDKAQQTADKLKEEGKDTARIVIPDEKDEVSEARIKVPTTTISVISQGNINLEIDTENARINIPKESIKGVNEDLKEDLFFRVIPLKKEEQKSEVIERAKKEEVVREVVGNSDISILGRPMTIETNMSQRTVDIVLPLKNVIVPQNLEEREEFLNKLGVFIEHSDGQKVLIKGEIVEYKDGVLGIKFSINKFSTFTIVKLNEGEFKENVYGSPKTFMRDKEIKITFNRDLNNDSLTKDSIYVEDSKGNKVETVLKYNAIEKTVAVKPAKYYNSGETYYLYVTDTVISISGKSINRKVKYIFKIEK